MRYPCLHTVVPGSGFLFVCLLSLLTQSVPALGENAPPMVEKHIFSPETVRKIPLEDKKSPVVKQIERQIVFTGVIISPDGRRAMMREKVVRGGKRHSEFYKEGDEINGMTIKQIGSNFIILTDQGKNVKLNLYQGAKVRPAPPAMPAVEKTPETAAGRQSESSPAVKEEKPGKRPTTQVNPPKPAGQPPRSGSIAPNPSRALRKNAPNPSNPFLEALRRAAEKNR
jgi:hypothetical protein